MIQKLGKTTVSLLTVNLAVWVYFWSFCPGFRTLQSISLGSYSD